jgi:SAM-dependent methyltransferase
MVVDLGEAEVLERHVLEPVESRIHVHGASADVVQELTKLFLVHPLDGSLRESMRGRMLMKKLILGSIVACFAAPIFAQELSLHEKAPDVPYVPTPPEVVEAMLKVADVSKTDYVIDLGCGDGRIVIAAAQKFGARGLGIDINPERIEEARENARKAGVDNLVEFKKADLFDADISKATVVTLYLLTSVNLKLRPKLLHDLRPGTRVVSHSFEMGEWKPEKTVEVGYRRVYFWTIPAQHPHFNDDVAR